jgi:hypothetical protein
MKVCLDSGSPCNPLGWTVEAVRVQFETELKVLFKDIVREKTPNEPKIGLDTPCLGGPPCLTHRCWFPGSTGMALPTFGWTQRSKGRPWKAEAG